MKGQTLHQRLAVLRRLSRWASSGFRIFEELDRRDNANGLSDVWPHRSFLIFSGHSLRESSFIWLNALFEKDPKTVNFTSVIAQLKMLGICRSELSEIEAELLSCQHLQSKLARLRGAAVAHRNAKKTYDEHFAEVRMTSAEMHLLLATASEVSGRLARLGGLEPEQPLWDPADNLNDVMSALLADTERRTGLFGEPREG